LGRCSRKDRSCFPGRHRKRRGIAPKTTRVVHQKQKKKVSQITDMVEPKIGKNRKGGQGRTFKKSDGKGRGRGGVDL